MIHISCVIINVCFMITQSHTQHYNIINQATRFSFCQSTVRPSVFKNCQLNYEWNKK